MRLLAITDVEQASEETHLEAYAKLLRHIPMWIELRDRRDTRRVIAFGRRLLGLGAPLIVNDRLDVALVLGARGAHLGRASVSIHDARQILGPAAWISCSVHPRSPHPRPLSPGGRGELSDAWRLEELEHDAQLPSPLGGEGSGVRAPGAYLVSPVFVSPGKSPPVGVRAITEMRGRFPTATLLALGGVDASNARACLDAGADGVAMIRAALDVASHEALAHALR